MILERTPAAEAVRVADLNAERAECRFLWPPIAIAVILFWIVPLGTGFGGDEASNWWVIKDGLREAIARATGPQSLPGGQSIFYNLLPLAAQALGGQSEIVLRLPSVLAMLGALLLLYRIGVRLIGPLAAMFGCLVFITMGDVVQVASTLRPYALALLCVAGAVLALMNWLDTGKLRHAAAYVLLAALTVYAHYLFALMYAVHAMYLVARLRRHQTTASWGAVMLACLASAAALVPLAPAVLRLLANRHEHAYAATPDVWALLASLAPPVLMGAIVLGILLALAAGARVAADWKLSAPAGWFLAVWALAPPVILFAVSWSGGATLFVPRYYLPAAPAVALFTGALVRSVHPAGVRRLIASTILICSLIQFGVLERFARGAQGWRETAQAVRDHVGGRPTPVLAVSSFIEARGPDGASEPGRSDALFAPLLRYPTGGRLVRLPWFSEESAKYVADALVPRLREEPEFLLVGLSGAEDYETWFEGRLGDRFSARPLGYYGGIKVVSFERRTKPEPP